ncbi:MAG: HEPN domain-containing protein [Deltaproteobacteria bacterium]|nr:HEPN domain-containing protein [Deltaproteobacteria bacterium]
MRKDAGNFMISAEYDLATAEHMLKSGRYIYVVFMCHLALEKMLKAIAVETTNSPSPKTHNLLYLTKLAEINFSQKHLEFVSKINNASIITRYPEDFTKLVEVYPADIVASYLEQTKDVIAWLKQNEKFKK